jgi:hypothetical protein
MTTAVKKLLSSFDTLTTAEQKQAADAIWRRLAKLESPSLSDEDLIATAEEAFLELDAREAAHEKRRAR